MSFTHTDRLSNATPVKVGAELVPVAVVVCWCVPKADPVNVSAGTVPADPVKTSADVTLDDPDNVGTPAGHAIVGEVSVPLCPSAGTVRFGAVALQAFAAPVPINTLVAAQLPVVAVARFTKEPMAIAPLVGTPAGHAIVPSGVTVPVAFVPTGVKLTVPFVPAGVPAETSELAILLPVKVGAVFVPVGVIVSLPPVVPTSPFAATVPMIVLPLSAATSVQPAAQVPLARNTIDPAGTPAPSLANERRCQTGGLYWEHR